MSSSWKMNIFSVTNKIITHFQVCIISMNTLYVCDVPKKLEVFFVKKKIKKFCLFIQDTSLLESSKNGCLEDIKDALLRGANVNIGNDVC